jgi:transcriptional regulator with XRE-family HTH domain
VRKKPEFGVTGAARKSENDNEPIQQVFARNLRRARREAGLTQAEVQKRTGLSRSFISAVETANVPNLDIDIGISLARAVGKPFWLLLTPGNR